MTLISIIILAVNLGDSILDNSKWGKISEDIAKIIHSWNRVRLCLRGKKKVVNQTLSYKLWLIGQICSIPKYTKKEYMISFETGKKRVLPDIQLNSPLDEWTRYFIHREQIKLSKNKMDSRAIKSHQFSLEKPHVVSTLLLNYHQGLALFKQKQILRSTVVTYIYKK